MIINLTEKCNQSRFAEIVSVSQPLVSDLIKRGILNDNESVGDWIKLYCSHLREIAAGRAANGELNLAAERAALSREQRIRIEMQNAVTRREYGPIESLETGLADCLSKIAAQLDTIPGKLKRQSNNLTTDDLNTVRAVIAEVRNQLANMEINWFDDKNNDYDHDYANDDYEPLDQTS